MPRVGQVKALGDERLTDRIAIGVLTSMFPPALVIRSLDLTDSWHGPTLAVERLN